MQSLQSEQRGTGDVFNACPSFFARSGGFYVFKLWPQRRTAPLALAVRSKMPLVVGRACMLLYVTLQASFTYHVFLAVVQRFAKLSGTDFAANSITGTIEHFGKLLSGVILHDVTS